MRMNGHFKDQEPAINLDVGPREIEFLVDTGFTGGLMIPEVLANDRSRGISVRHRTADPSVHLFDGD